MPIVEVPGVGEIEFPDGMSNQEIEGIIKKQFFPEQKTAPVNNYQPPVDSMAESMAMFNPAGVGQEAVNYAPEIGLMAGGLMGAGPMSVPLAGMGYTAGQTVKGAFQPQPQKPSLALGQEQAMPDLMSLPTINQTQDMGAGMAMELGGKGVGWLASKAWKPIQQGLSMLRAGQLADKGLPIPASAINPDETGIALAKKARETYPGNKIVAEAHEKLRTGADEMIKDLSAKYNLYEHNPKGIADQAFDAWAEAMGGNKASIQMENTISKIREVLNDPIVVNAAPKDKKALWWKQQAASFADNPTLQGLRDIWATITSKGGGTDRTKRNELLQAIQSDLETNYGDEIVNLLNQARDKNAWSKKANILKGIIDRSTSKEKGLQFNPDVFAYEWQKVVGSPRVRNFTRQELSELSELSEMMEVIGSELKQKIKDTGPASLLAQGGGLGGIAAGLSMLGLPGAKMAALGSVALPGMKYLSSRNAGAMYQPGSALYRQMLGEPMAREMLPGLVNIGGKLMLLEGKEMLK